MNMDILRILFPLLIIGVAVVYILYLAKSKKKDAGQDKDDQGVDNYMAEGMSIGMCLGIALSTALDQDMAMGISLGMLFGMAIGMGIKK